ncbi:ATP-binding cassette domain-containing protein [Streptomyces sp. NPDC046557]|uniref:ATP-binding cassette domain-containing protein n=1 Tax=Streptomyces sp. NPDC046557 TaxID=3155372 RepID=UPI0034027206
MTTAGTLLLRCQDAARTYGHGPAAVVAVDSATCQVHVGDRIAITGPSGSGKSTLLHLMADVEQPTAGEISWPGLPRVPAHGQVGVVGQGLTLVPALNVAENSALPLAAGRRSQGTGAAEGPALPLRGGGHRPSPE